MNAAALADTRLANLLDQLKKANDPKHLVVTVHEHRLEGNPENEDSTPDVCVKITIRANEMDLTSLLWVTTLPDPLLTNLTLRRSGTAVIATAYFLRAGTPDHTIV